MITKIAAFILVGSVAALAVAGVADLSGLDEKLGWNHHVTRRYEKHIGRHGARHVRKRVEHRVERRVEADIAAEIQAVSGTYVFDAGGEALGKFPWSARAELHLQPGGRYELRVKTDIDNDMSEETSYGRYKVRGDRLLLYSLDDHSEHEFRINGDRLEFDADFHQKVALKVVGLHDAALVKQRE